MRIACIVSLILAVSAAGQPRAESAPSQKLVQKIPLSSVKGRIDHMAIDLKGGRLFVAALGNDTVEVVDLKAGKQVHTIRGLAEPQGVLYLAETNQIYVTNGRTGDCWVLDGESFKVTTTIPLGEDADNLRYDPAARRVYVAYGAGAIGVIDAASMKRIGDIKLAGHPESFQLDKGSGTIFVNVPSAKQIAVLDANELRVKTVWPLKAAQENFPMALDSAGHRLFVGTRKPAKLLILDTESGKLLQTLNIDDTTDDVFYYAPRGFIYVSCGAGFLNTIQRKDTSEYASWGRIPTAAGARTCLLVPETATLYLAVPAQSERDASIWVYDVNPS